MAKSTKALLTGRIQMCKTNPSVAHIGLATHGRSIQIGSSNKIAIVVKATEPIEYLDIETMGFEPGRFRSGNEIE